MEMRTVFQLIVSGLTIGCVYSLVGLAFALLIRATGILNFAQGELVMLGAFIGLTILTYLHLPYLVAFLVANPGAAASPTGPSGGNWPLPLPVTLQVEVGLYEFERKWRWLLWQTVPPVLADGDLELWIEG